MDHEDHFALTDEEEDMLVGTGQPGRDRRMNTMNECPWTTTDECRMVRERSVAGISDSIPACAQHGPYSDEPSPEGGAAEVVSE